MPYVLYVEYDEVNDTNLSENWNGIEFQSYNHLTVLLIRRFYSCIYISSNSVLHFF